jgi:hypothetical protein
MCDEHWSDDVLVEKLLLGGPEEEGHVRHCPACAKKWEQARLRRANLLASEPEIPEVELAKERHAIRARLQRRPIRVRLVPTLAAAALAILAMLVLLKPVPQPVVQESTSDAAVFEEVFKVSSSTEPTSVEPVKSLFEVQP